MKKKNDSQILIERANQREKEAIERINKSWRELIDGLANSILKNGKD